MQAPPSFGALVVLYRPSAAQLGHLLALAAACPRLLAVDNSPVPELAQHRALAAAGIAVLANGNRGGIGGAFNRGLAWLRERGATVAVLFDQDSEVPPGYFEALAQACARMDRPDFMIGPRVFDVNAGRCVPAFTFGRLGLRAVAVDDCPREALLPCNFLLSSGAAISLAAHERIGPFREDFVIDHVDSEHGLRAAALGVPMFMSCAATLQHAIGRLSTHRLFGRRIVASNHPAPRRYYFARNTVRLTLRHGWRHPALLLVNGLVLAQLVAVLLFEADKRRKTVAALAGLLDGLCGRLGPFEQRQRRLAAWCARS